MVSEEEAVCSVFHLLIHTDISGGGWSTLWWPDIRRRVRMEYGTPEAAFVSPASVSK